MTSIVMRIKITQFTQQASVGMVLTAHSFTTFLMRAYRDYFLPGLYPQYGYWSHEYWYA